VAIHRVIYGSMERFIGILIEHFAGAFPLWLAPMQAKVIPVSEKHLEYAEKVVAELRAEKIRAEISIPDESLGKRIRSSELEKVPCALIVGDKEVDAGTVSVRRYKGSEENGVKLEKLTAALVKEIREKELK
jgi:threonyl-tRNA synthetase